MTSSDPDSPKAGSLPAILPIRPFTRPVSGRVRVPGSKSITNRALLLAALSSGRTRIANALVSDDSTIMEAALRALGFDLTTDPATGMIEVEGLGGHIPHRDATLAVGNAGTAARFLTALCCLAPDGTFRMDGVEQMRRRPIRGLVEALRQGGAQIEASPTDGFPLVLHPAGLRGGRISVDAGASSQILSALLMIAPFATEDLHIHLSNTRTRKPYIKMTLAMMGQFGLDADRILEQPDGFIVRSGSGYSGPGDTYRVESDASTASYFLALPAVAGGALKIEDLRLDGLQGDTAFAGILESLGCQMEATGGGIRMTRPASDRRLKAGAHDFFEISDTFLTLAALAPLLDGPTRISGIAHTRQQETDRVAAVANELRKLGQEVIETDDSLTIQPAPLREADIETYHDHRVAMAFAILGCHDLHGDGRPWLRIVNPATCAKTFPGFFDALEAIRNRS
ncbi:MAG: 3-phosphoshikimate 1-carboxyvinyltransferase [Opitutaceae bacterium]